MWGGICVGGGCWEGKEREEEGTGWGGCVLVQHSSTCVQHVCAEVMQCRPTVGRATSQTCAVSTCVSPYFVHVCSFVCSTLHSLHRWQHQLVKHVVNDMLTENTCRQKILLPHSPVTPKELETQCTTLASDTKSTRDTVQLELSRKQHNAHSKVYTKVNNCKNSYQGQHQMCISPSQAPQTNTPPLYYPHTFLHSSLPSSFLPFLPPLFPPSPLPPHFPPSTHHSSLHSSFLPPLFSPLFPPPLHRSSICGSDIICSTASRG